MEIPDYLTCLLKNLYVGQEATVRTGHGATDWFQIGKGVLQSSISSPCLFILYTEYSMRNTGLDEAQAGTRLPGEISVTSGIQITPSLWQKVKLLSRVQLFVAPWTVAHQAPLSMGFSRQEYWSGLPFPTGNLLYGSGNSNRGSAST